MRALGRLRGCVVDLHAKNVLRTISNVDAVKLEVPELMAFDAGQPDCIMNDRIDDYLGLAIVRHLSHCALVLRF